MNAASSPWTAVQAATSSSGRKSKRVPRLKRHGAHATIRDVELLRVGTWPASTGSVTFTRSHLAAAVARSQSPDFRLPRVRLGHTQPTPGAPSIGVVTGLRLADGGSTLVGDLEDIPIDLARRLATDYPDRSIEGVMQGDEFELTGLALLGAEHPAVAGLNSMRELIAASRTTARPGRWVSTF